MKKYVKASTVDKVWLYVEWYPYEPFLGRWGDKLSANLSGDTVLDALVKVVMCVSLGLEPNDILAGEYDSPEKVVEEIIASNGDDKCDYIVLLQNKNTGEILIDEDYEGEYEDWDED